jgi:hypothetical protein
VNGYGFSITCRRNKEGITDSGLVQIKQLADEETELPETYLGCIGGSVELIPIIAI